MQLQTQSWKQKFIKDSIFYLVILVHIWFVTFGTMDILKGEDLGIAYDSLGKSLLHLDCSVEESAISFERYVRNGKVFMNWGIWPSILRIIFNSFFPSLYGNWSRLSCILASVLTLITILAIFTHQANRNNMLTRIQKDIVVYSSFVGFGLGSPLLFLMGIGHIYHEAILWGLCWSTIGIYYFLKLISNEENKSLYLLGFSLASTLALLSRATFGIPLCVILFFILQYIFMKLIFGKNNLIEKNIHLSYVCTPVLNMKKRSLKIILLITPAIFCLTLQAWYNHCRFGSFAVFENQKYYVHEPRLMLPDKGEINVKRIPSAFISYFSIYKNSFMSNAPYFFLVPPCRISEHLYLEFKEPIISPLIASPWIIIGGLFGIIWILLINKNNLIKLTFLPFLIQFGIVLSFWGISERYVADFLPLFIYLYSFYILALGKNKFLAHVNKLLWINILLSLISVIVTVLSTLSFVTNISWYTPQEYKNRLNNCFRLIDSFVSQQHLNLFIRKT